VATAVAGKWGGGRHLSHRRMSAATAVVGKCGNTGARDRLYLVLAMPGSLGRHAMRTGKLRKRKCDVEECGVSRGAMSRSAMSGSAMSRSAMSREGYREARYCAGMKN
jgi:hypothetical protein